MEHLCLSRLGFKGISVFHSALRKLAKAFQNLQRKTARFANSPCAVWRKTKYRCAKTQWACKGRTGKQGKDGESRRGGGKCAAEAHHGVRGCPRFHRCPHDPKKIHVHSKAVMDMMFLPNIPSRMVTCSLDSRIVMWDLDRDVREITEVGCHDNGVCHLAYSEPYQFLLSTGYETYAYAWSVAPLPQGFA